MISIYGYFVGNFAIVFAVLLFAALAVLLSDRTGVINIAINGQVLAGALVFAVFGNYLGANHKLPPGTQVGFVLATMVIISLWSLLFAIPVIFFRTNQIITGTAFNLLVAGIALFIVNTSSVKEHLLQTHFTVLAIDHRYHIASLYLILALATAAGFYCFFRLTKAGLRLSVCGENQYSAGFAGINVLWVRLYTQLATGGFAGLAGCVYTFYKASSFDGNVDSIGFVALAIMIFGQWRTMWIVVGCFLFGWLYALGNYLPQFTGVGLRLKNNAVIFKTIPFIGTILVMVGFWKYNNQPHQLGMPYFPQARVKTT